MDLCFGITGNNTVRDPIVTKFDTIFSTIELMFVALFCTAAKKVIIVQLVIQSLCKCHKIQFRVYM